MEATSFILALSADHPTLDTLIRDHQELLMRDNADRLEFHVPFGGARHPGRWILAGVALCVVAGIGFVVAEKTHAGQLNLHLMATLPTIMAAGLFIQAMNLRRTPLRI